ncbi:MAG: LytTR family transcriptional regulator DNA-binding domain-containing protein, partial [Chitinophagaceae bacterium]
AFNNFEEKKVAQNETATKSNSFFVKVGNKYKKIEWQKVVALISDKKYTKILVANDNVEYFIGNTLPKTLQNILPPHLQNNFVQINRAEVVNTEYITELKSSTITTLHHIFEATDGYLPELKNRLNLV